MKWFTCKEKLPKHNQYILFIEGLTFNEQMVRKGRFIRTMSDEPMYFAYKVRFDKQEDDNSFRFTMRNGKSNLNIVRITQVYCWTPLPKDK
jgi:hypothetical protein